MTIEERAYALAKEFGSTKANKESAIYRACIRMATEQKQIDDEENGKALLYCADKTAERVKKEMVEKACNSFCHTGCPHKTDSFDCLNNKCDTWKIFKRMMEE